MKPIKPFYKVKNPAGSDALDYLYSNYPSSVSKIMNKLFSIMDGTNGLICTQSGLAAVSEMSLVTVKRAMYALQEEGFIRWHKIAQGLCIEINSNIVTKCSEREEIANTGYELWSCKILAKKQSEKELFSNPLKLSKE